MTHDGYAERGPWCLVCGKPAEVAYESMDARHPVGGHPPREGASRWRHHGLITRDPAEAEAAWRAERVELATRNHDLHVAHKRAAPYCRDCDAIRDRTRPVHQGSPAGRR